jgi:hypothetical protein
MSDFGTRSKKNNKARFKGWIPTDVRAEIRLCVLDARTWPTGAFMAGAEKCEKPSFFVTCGGNGDVNGQKKRSLLPTVLWAAIKDYIDLLQD